MTGNRASESDRKPDEGYIYCSFGPERYLHHVVASVTSLRRYDADRPVVLWCTPDHKELLERTGLSDLFYQVHILDEPYRSITGFKHNLYRFMPFHRNLYLDSDIIWCKNPEKLWTSFLPYGFTITGNETADLFFGGPKGVGIIRDFLLMRRRRTLKRFNLTYLSRVQSGMIYASDRELTRRISHKAEEYLANRELTHFRSRKNENGRKLESCEWSLAMAMSEMKVRVFPWLAGEESPQLDFLERYTDYDPEFRTVHCLLYMDRFTYDLKAIRPDWLRRLLLRISTLRPGKGDHVTVTPYCLHFGWYHQKEPFHRFAEKNWAELTNARTRTTSQALKAAT